MSSATKRRPRWSRLPARKLLLRACSQTCGHFFESVKLSVAPLRYGAGIKGKINLSMGFGVPVVATSLAVEGMALTDREDVLIADEPEDFARAVVELYESEDLWNRIS